MQTKEAIEQRRKLLIEEYNKQANHNSIKSSRIDAGIRTLEWILN